MQRRKFFASHLLTPDAAILQWQVLRLNDQSVSPQKISEVIFEAQTELRAKYLPALRDLANSQHKGLRAFVIYNVGFGRV